MAYLILNSRMAKTSKFSRFPCLWFSYLRQPQLSILDSILNWQESSFKNMLQKIYSRLRENKKHISNKKSKRPTKKQVKCKAILMVVLKHLDKLCKYLQTMYEKCYGKTKWRLKLGDVKTNWVGKDLVEWFVWKGGETRVDRSKSTDG